MANRNTQGFGLMAAGTLGSTPATSGQGKYKIDAGYGTTIYNGGAVASAAGYIVEGQGTDTPILGVLNGIFYNAATTLKPTFANAYIATITPANSEDTKAFVNDNPFQLYNVSTDAAVATTVVGAHAIYLDTFGVNTGGSTSNGRSSTTLNIGATHATNDTWRLIRSAEDPENNDLTAAYCTVVVIQNLNEYIDSTGA